ncbi:aldehyde dehydrogenase 3, member A2, partial [Modicella reniformis]
MGPVTLELALHFVAKDGNIDVVARRLTIGKFFNCGQPCIAPDCLIVERGIKGRLIEQIKKNVQGFYGASVHTSYARIINKNRFQRLIRFLDNTKGENHLWWRNSEDDLYIAPTLVLNVQEGDFCWSVGDEPSRPIHPIMVVEHLAKEGLTYVKRRYQLLALYIFSEDRSTINHILGNTRSGRVLVNDKLLQFSTTLSPFGGTGSTDIGSNYHQKSFDTFSHKRSTSTNSRAWTVPTIFAIL